MKGADAETFMVDEHGLPKDKYHVFVRGGYTFEYVPSRCGIDPATAEYFVHQHIDFDDRTTKADLYWNDNWMRDSKHVYYRERRMNVDRATFRWLAGKTFFDQAEWYVDKNFVYALVRPENYNYENDSRPPFKLVRADSLRTPLEVIPDFWDERNKPDTIYCASHYLRNGRHILFSDDEICKVVCDVDVKSIRIEDGEIGGPEICVINDTLIWHEMKNPFKEFLYFSMGDRRAIVALGCIAVFAIGVLMVVDRPSPQPSPSMERVTGVESGPDGLSIMGEMSAGQRGSLGTFDPNNDWKSNKFHTLTKVDVNTADTAMLRRIPGVGAKISEAIVEYRERLGGFHSVEQLREIKMVSPELLEWMEVSSSSNIQKINLNKSSFQALNSHPYISYDQTKALLQYIRLYGKVKDEQALLETGIFTQEEVERLKPYLDYE